MPRRQQARIGLSYVDANRGRVVSIESDVLEIGRRIHERWPELEAFWDKDNMEYVVVEHCKDGVDRMACARPYLDERLIRDLEAADTSRRGQEDPVAMVDALNEVVQKRHDQAFSDKLGEAGERLLFALKKDGIGGVVKVAIPNKP